MADSDARDESISILLDEGSGLGYQQPGAPQFEIYTGRPPDGSTVEDASHYALNITCQSLKKRNRDLEHQLTKVQRERNRLKSVKMDGDRRSMSPPSGDSTAFRMISHSQESLAAQEQFIQYLQDSLSKEQTEKRDLASQLDNEKSMVHALKGKIKCNGQELDDSLSLLKTRRKELESTRGEIDTLKCVIIQQRRELKSADDSFSVLGSLQSSQELGGQVNQLNAEMASLQQIYEDTAAHNQDLENKSGVWQREKSQLQITIVEKDKIIERLRSSTSVRCSRDDVDPVIQLGAAASNRDINTQCNLLKPVTDEMLAETKQEIVALQTEVINMQSTIVEQSTVIRRLYDKLKQRVAGSLSSSLNGLSLRSNAILPASNPIYSSAGGARPRDPPCSVPESKPVYCEEDLQGMDQSDEPTTLTYPGSQLPGQTSHDLSAAAANMLRLNAIRVPPPLERPPVVGAAQDSSVTPSGMMDAHQMASSTGGIHQVAHSLAGLPQQKFNFQIKGIIPSRDEAESMIHHPPLVPSAADVRSITEPITLGHPRPANDARRPVTEPITGDNRLSAMGAAAASPRHIPIERNIDPLVTNPHNNQLQNVNLVEMMYDKNRTPYADANQPQTHVVFNNDPMVGSKPIPPRNIYDGSPDADRPTRSPPVRTCPVCDRDYPADMTQRDFETHVDKCLSNTMPHNEASPPEATSSSVDEPDVVMKECPVCNAVFPPGTNHILFEDHVESHFVGQGYEVINAAV